MPRLGALAAGRGLRKGKLNKGKKRSDTDFEREPELSSVDDGDLPGPSEEELPEVEEEEGDDTPREMRTEEAEPTTPSAPKEPERPNPFLLPGPWVPAVLQKGEDGYKFKTKFKQQRYKVNIVCWQSPQFMLLFGAIWGAIFISYGSVMVDESKALHTVSVTYDCFGDEKCACDGMSSCSTTLEVPEGMDGRLVLFYELEGFKQNHRRYKPSLSLAQLRFPMDPESEHEPDDCSPRFNTTTPTPSVSARIDYGEVGVPCGLHTGWVFDDVVTVRGSGSEPVALGEEWRYGAWDRAPARFFNSNDTRFITWMRSSPFTLRKPLLRFDDGLAPGAYSIDIENHYDSAIFRGQKKLVLSEYNASGGGRFSTYSIGCVCVVVGCALVCMSLCILGLGLWGKSPLRKRRKLLEQMLAKADASQPQGFSLHDVPWTRNSFINDAGAPNDMDEAIRRGLDLIERYAAAPTVEALEALVAGQPAGGRGPQVSTIISAAKRMSDAQTSLEVFRKKIEGAGEIEEQPSYQEV